MMRNQVISILCFNMKNNLLIIPFIIVLVSILIIGSFLRYGLYLDTKKLSQDFLAQNALELYSADIFRLSSKLNRLHSVGDWSCLVGYIDEKEFFSIKDSSCDSGLYRHQSSIYIKESNVKIDMTLVLSDEKIKLFSVFLFFQTCIFLSFRVSIFNIEKKKQEQLIRFNEKAIRFSHDVRSPLSALSSIIKDQNVFISQDLKKIIESSIEMIKKSANDLLDAREKSRVMSVVNLKIAISEIIEIKKREFPNVEIVFNGFDILGACEENGLKRIVSNILNNSIESSLDKDVKIIINIIKVSDKINITIEDNGTGIPDYILKNLGYKQITTKKEGNGIGILSAKEEIKSWGGDLILSSSSRGTKVTLILNSLDWNIKIVLIDDDELTRILWENAALKSGLELKCFKDSETCLSNLESFDKDTQFYIDNHIGNERGIILAEKLYNLGFKKLYMATGSNPEEFADISYIKGVIGKEPPF